MIKSTIMQMLKKEFPNVTITDTPMYDNNIESQNNDKIKLLFIGYDEGNETRLKVIDYDSYMNYRDEKEVVLEDVADKYVLINNKKYKVVSYENGVLRLYRKVKDLYEYNDCIEFVSPDLQPQVPIRDWMFCYSAYNYSQTLNYNIVAYYYRFNIDIFIYDDDNNDKVMDYSKKIGKIFNRDFPMLDKSGKKTRETIYVVNQLNFNMTEYNGTNKIIRGSILLRVYSNE